MAGKDGRYSGYPLDKREPGKTFQVSEEAIGNWQQLANSK
jgi:hypothetical protein